MQIDPGDTVWSIVNRDQRAARIFVKHGFDFCFGERMTFPEACREAGVSPKLVLNELSRLTDPTQEMLPDLSEMPIDDLTIFIEKFYHQYTEETVLFIRKNMGRLVRVHGNGLPELEVIGRVFENMTSHLALHMNQEEFMLFPYIRRMAAHEGKRQNRVFKSVKRPIAVMVRDHENEGEDLKRLESLTHHYTAQGSACNTLKITYAAMRELHANISDHFHVENNILFPKAIQLEELLSMG